jgi:hypothetical protein
VHGEEKGQSAEVDIVCAVDGLRGAEYGVCNGDAAAQEGRVFYVVDAANGLEWQGVVMVGEGSCTVNSQYAAYPPLE